MLTDKALRVAIALVAFIPSSLALAEEPAEARAANSLAPLSAEAVVDAELPRARIEILEQAKTWHRAAQQRLRSLPACRAGRSAVACWRPENDRMASRAAARTDRGGCAGGEQAQLAP